MIKTVIFDLSEVCLNGLIGTEKGLEPILNLPADVIYKCLRIDELIDLFEGRISENHYILEVIKKNNWNIRSEALKNIIRSNFKEIEGVRVIIESLKAKGYKLGLLSDHSKEWIEYCEKKFEFHKLFDSILYSFEIHACKPDKKPYQLILQILHAKPDECLFVDDSKKNTEAAEKLGISTILFKNAEQLKIDLEKFSINISS